LEISILSVVLLWVSLGAAALQGQFFGISRIISRGLVAVVVWIGLLTIYAVALFGLSRVIAPPNSLTAQFGTAITSVALVAATFWPLQHQLRRLLERALFRDVYEYAETLRELSSEIVHFASADAIVARPLAVGREA
jgi:uncharacterized membrane protein